MRDRQVKRERAACECPDCDSQKDTRQYNAHAQTARQNTVLFRALTNNNTHNYAKMSFVKYLHNITAVL